MTATNNANKGKIKPPHFVTQQRQQNQGEITVHNTQDADHRPVTLINDEHWEIVLEALHQTVASPKGTAHRTFAGATYEAAGKTGTAQVVSIAQDEKYDEKKISERNRDNAMYIGYAPFDDPKIVIAVAIENTGSGSSTAAPVARKVLDKYFANQQKMIANAK